MWVMHTVAVLALDKVIPFDLSTPIEVFTRTRSLDGAPAYRVLVCAADKTVDTEMFALQVHWGLDVLATAETVIVPGRSDVAAPVSDEIVGALREAAARGTRIASICTGAFILAAAGLLDGLGATTHWLCGDELATRYPEIAVNPEVLYVDNGQFLTSAGASAGLDMCLHMIRRDHGSAVAAAAARLAVMPAEREGGQAQFIVNDLPPTPRGSLLEPVLSWLDDHLHRDLTLADIAEQAGMSARTLNRRFREQTGTTPLRWLHRARIRRAQHLLESTEHSVDRIAGLVGFGSPTAFRDHFKRIVGTSPNAYRAAFH